MYTSVSDVRLIYDQYVEFYNGTGTSIVDHIRVLSDLKTVEIAIDDHNSLQLKSTQDAILSLTMILLDINNDVQNEGDNNCGSTSILKLRNDILDYIKTKFRKDKQLDISDHFDFWYVKNTAKKLIKNLNNKGLINELDFQLHILEVEYKRLLQAKNHSSALEIIIRHIIDNHYPIRIKSFNELSENEKTKIRTNSNSEKLYVANNWLFNIISDISLLEEPTHEMVLDIIQKEFPEFEHVPGKEDLSFIKGLNNINKSSIDKALRYLFNEKYDDNIAEGTIRSKFNKYGMW